MRPIDCLKKQHPRISSGFPIWKQYRKGLLEPPCPKPSLSPCQSRPGHKPFQTWQKQGPTVSPYVGRKVPIKNSILCRLQHRADMGQHRADLGQHTANLGEHRAHIGPTWGNIWLT